MQPAPLLPVTRAENAETSTDAASRSPPPRASPRCRLPPSPAAGSVQAGPLRRDQPLAAIGQHHQQLQPPVPAHPAQHPQFLPVQRVTRPRTPPCPAARRSPACLRPTCTRHPAAWHTARAARAAFTASMHRAASRRSTGMPSAMLAATSTTCRSPSEHGSIPCTALAAAAKSTAATGRSRNGSHPTSTATCRKSSRSSQPRCSISSSAAASVGSQPFAHARIASARSSKHVVRRGVVRRNRACPPHGPAPGKDHGQADARAGQGVPQGRDHDGRR